MENLRRIEFEDAKVLKELGFDWDTDKYYVVIKTQHKKHPQGYLENYKLRDCKEKMEDNSSSVRITAPTYVLVWEWLREVHDISVEIFRTTNGYDATIESQDKWANTGDRPDYKEVEKPALYRAIEILRNRK